MRRGTGVDLNEDAAPSNSPLDPNFWAALTERPERLDCCCGAGAGAEADGAAGELRRRAFEGTTAEADAAALRFVAALAFDGGRGCCGTARATTGAGLDATAAAAAVATAAFTIAALNIVGTGNAAATGMLGIICGCNIICGGGGIIMTGGGIAGGCITIG